LILAIDLRYIHTRESISQLEEVSQLLLAYSELILTPDSCITLWGSHCMRIKIEVVGLPALSQAVGKRETELDVPGREVTVRRVIDHLTQRFGPSAKKALYDQKGDLHPTIQIALNGKKFITRDRLDTSLNGGDTLTFMLLMAGGGDSGSS